MPLGTPCAIGSTQASHTASDKQMLQHGQHGRRKWRVRQPCQLRLLEVSAAASHGATRVGPAQSNTYLSDGRLVLKCPSGSATSGLCPNALQARHPMHGVQTDTLQGKKQQYSQHSARQRRQLVACKHPAKHITNAPPHPLHPDSSVRFPRPANVPAGIDVIMLWSRLLQAPARHSRDTRRQPNSTCSDASPWNTPGGRPLILLYGSRLQG